MNKNYLDFFNKEVGVHIYNKALNELGEELKARLETITEETVYTMEEEVK